MSKENDHVLVDVHCHYLHIWYVFLETLNWLWVHARKTRDAHPAGRRKEATSAAPGAIPLVQYLVDLVRAAGSLAKDNYQTEMGEYEKSDFFKKDNRTLLMTVPLMMDVFYFRDSGKGSMDEAILEVPRIAGLRRSCERILHTLIKKEFHRRGRPLTDERNPDTRAVNALFRRLDALTDSNVLGDTIDFDGVDMTLGYKVHLLELLGLARPDQAGKVFPFLAVDPRRRGILKLVTQLVRPTGPFYGVKLYPALGYWPDHPSLLPVYKHCEANQVPITVHCLYSNRFGSYARSIRAPRHFFVSGTDGYQDYVSSKTKLSPPEFFGPPNAWDGILANYDLRVNFAHFGGPDFDTLDSRNWTWMILAMMKTHKRKVYADLSCYSPADVATVMKILKCKHHMHAAEFLMFGTDYVILLLSPQHGQLSGYLRTFYEALHDASAPLPPNLFCENARKFLRQ